MPSVHTERRLVGPAAIFDRDGTVNVERHYLSSPEQVELLPGAAAGMRRLQRHGYRLLLVTNQSGLARGYFDEARLAQVHQRLRALLAAEGVTLERIYYCPHHPAAGCGCRKPRPGLIYRAACELGFAPEDAVVFGDKPCDIDAGRAVGARTVLVATGYGAEFRAAGQTADYYAPTLEHAAKLLTGAGSCAPAPMVRKGAVADAGLHQT